MMINKFKNIAYIMIEPPAFIISIHKINNDEEYNNLLKSAKNKDLLLYMTEVVEREDGKYIAQNTWELIRESLGTSYKSKKHDNIDVKEVKKNLISEDEIICPYCNKKLNSLFGRTNHIKSKHPEKLEDYKKYV